MTDSTHTLPSALSLGEAELAQRQCLSREEQLARYRELLALDAVSVGPSTPSLRV